MLEGIYIAIPVQTEGAVFNLHVSNRQCSRDLAVPYLQVDGVCLFGGALLLHGDTAACS